jgi:FtsP/CotA-like multicopper oxidase with cupredoxin domain
MKLAALMSLAGLGVSLTTGVEVNRPILANQLSHTKQFELNLTWESWAADGVARRQFLVNGQFPGPPLVMDEGDNVEVTVNNFSPFNTTIHYHGIEWVLQ